MPPAAPRETPSGASPGRSAQGLRRVCQALLLLALCLEVWAARPAAGQTQSWRILALRVDFPAEDPDQPTTTGQGRFDLRSLTEALPDYRYPYDTPPHDRVYFERHLQALARYYDVVSEGRVRIEAAVYPTERERAYTLSRSALSYGNGRTPEEVQEKWVQVLREALQLAAADPEGPRLADYNSFLVFHAGQGHETGELNDIRSVYLTPDDLGEPLQVGGVQVRDGWILPEAADTQGRAGLNGLLAKFFGHQLGLPGLSNFADGLPAVGGWSLMDLGANRGGYLLDQGQLQPLFGFVPPHPMAWSKIRLGWIAPLEVQRDTTVSLVATDRRAALPKAVRIPIADGEYYLLENRQQRARRGAPAGVEAPFRDEVPVWIRPEQVRFSEEGHRGVWLEVDEYDAFVPGSGVLVWHVDETAIAARLEAGTINNDPLDPGIFLEEADGYRDIGNPNFDRMNQIEGSPQDPFFVGGTTTFGPDSRSKAGAETGIVIEVLSAPGDTMQVRIRFARSAAGWPVAVAGGRKLQAADLDGDGAVELMVESAAGVQVGRYATSLDAWAIPGGRLLASGDADGDGNTELFVAQGSQVSAWRAGADRALWSRTLAAEPTTGLHAVGLGAAPGVAVLALLDGNELRLLEARTGQVVRQEQVPAANMAAADLDDDGGLELVLGSDSGIWVLDGQGLHRRELTGSALPLATGDLDGDGRAELVVAGPAGDVQIAAGQTVMEVALGDSLVAGPVLGDVDGDGFLEVVLAGRERVHGLRSGGPAQADFPLAVPRSERAGDFRFAPVLADVDGDGRQEVLIGAGIGLFCLQPRTGVLPGFPLLTAGPVEATPVAADLDGDGKLELAALAGQVCNLWEPDRVSPTYAGAIAGWGQEGASAASAYAPVGIRQKPGPNPRAELMPAGRVYCYPNPVAADGQAHLRFFLAQPARLELQVFDPLGERLERLEADREWGEGEIDWSIREYASGLYLCRLEARSADGRRADAVVQMAVSR